MGKDDRGVLPPHTEPVAHMNADHLPIHYARPTLWQDSHHNRIFLRSRSCNCSRICPGGASICTLLLLRAKPSPPTTGTPAHEVLRETYGGRYIFVCADLTKAEDVERAVVTCAKEFSRLDVIVNNAGISVGGTHVRPLRIHETAEDGYDKIMAVNAKEAFLGCKYAIPRSNEDRSSLARVFFVAQSICLDFNFRARSVAAPD
jgi:hypothetical protein